MDTHVLVAVLLIVCTTLLAYLVYDRKSSGQNVTKPAAQRKDDGKQAASDAKVLAELQRLPVRVLYSTTTGTARRFAEQIRREAFAFNVSGFHFNVQVTDLADYNAENLSDEKLVVILMPTYSGGVPPPSGVDLVSHLRDLSTDFRVDRNMLQNLRFAVFGLGSREYVRSADGRDNWCRAASDVHDGLLELSASAICDLGKGDESSDMEGHFKAWLNQLWPALCELYSDECGDPAANRESAGDIAANMTGSGASKQQKQQQAGSGGSCGSGCACSGGNKGSSGGGCQDEGGDSECCSSGGATKEWLPIKEHRRQKRAAAEAAKREAALAAALAAAAASSSSSAADDAGGLDDYTEEDAINDRLLRESDTMIAAMEAVDRKKTAAAAAASASATAVAEFVDSDDEDDDPAARKRKAAKPRATSGSGEALVDLEDMGSVIARAVEERKKEEEDSRAGAVREMITPAQRKALTKEGYKIIGTHSAVKLCRWTKAQLRGRGGCYKHTAYGE